MIPPRRIILAKGQLDYFLNYAYLEIWPSALFYSSPSSHIFRHFQPSSLPFLLIISTETCHFYLFLVLKRSKKCPFLIPSPSIFKWLHNIWMVPILVTVDGNFDALYDCPFWARCGAFPAPSAAWGTTYLWISVTHLWWADYYRVFLIKTLSKPGLAAHLDNPFA